MKNQSFPYPVKAHKDFYETEGLNQTSPYVKQSRLARLAIALQTFPENITPRKIGVGLLIGILVIPAVSGLADATSDPESPIAQAPVYECSGEQPMPVTPNEDYDQILTEAQAEVKLATLITVPTDQLSTQLTKINNAFTWQTTDNTTWHAADGVQSVEIPVTCKQTN